MIKLEPARYALTGGGMHACAAGMRRDPEYLCIVGDLGCLDAPDWLPVGSVSHSDEHLSLITATIREGAFR